MNLRNAAIPGTVTAVYRVTGGSFNNYNDLPPFTRVVVESAPEEGSHIVTEVWLPDDWNGIFVGTGNGGMAGKVVYWDMVPHIRSGYAMANTDMGTSGGRERGIANPHVWRDFGWRATHLMTVIAKALIEARYGRKPDYSYFIGSSTGGQQALAEAQRFPEDYDGIIAGVPANNRTFLHTYFLWNHIHLRTPDGRERFCDAEISEITAAAVKFFQQRGDGQPGDNFVSFPKQDDATVDAFIAFLAKELPFIDEQLDALHAVYSGSVDPVSGRRIYNGMPIGSEKYGCGIKECMRSESPHFYPFIWTFGADYCGRRFDFHNDVDKLTETLASDLNANNPDLSAFRDHGGKLLFYSGASDPCVPFPDAMRYAERVQTDMGGYAKTADFCRYYLLPGKDHGSGGDGTHALVGEDGKSLLYVLRDWRETGAMPEMLRAIRWENGREVLSRTVYPYGSPENPIGSCPPVCADEFLK